MLRARTVTSARKTWGLTRGRGRGRAVTTRRSAADGGATRREVMIGSAAGVGAVCAVEAAMRAQTNGTTMVNGAKDAKRALAELEALQPDAGEADTKKLKHS